MPRKVCNLNDGMQRVGSKFGETKSWEQDGDMYKGVYYGFEEKVGKNESKLYKFGTSKGPTSIWETHQINEAMKDIKPPCIVEIVYRGLKKIKGGRNVHSFNVCWQPLPEGFDIKKDTLIVEEDA